MTKRLGAWLEGRQVGQFAMSADGTVSFAYADDAPETPISLSLPRDGRATRRAAANFLANLLPDDKRARTQMAATYGASGIGIFELLAKAGGDVAGGLVLLPEGESPPAGVRALIPALDRDIAQRIASIKRDPDAWAPPEAPARFSLAGTQGKFALARIEDDWYWSNAGVPSTHIIKPGRPELRGLEAAEAAALGLVGRAGVPAPAASVLQVEDQTAFLIERFDRAPDGVLARRLHCEDLAQALGLGPDDKYQPTVKQIMRLLAQVDHGTRLREQFLAQLVFNVLVGNADAHAKNYSILLRPTGIEFAPVYDVVPVALYPQFDQDLAMRIAGARRPSAVRFDHWRKLAREADLDPDEVVELVRVIATGVAEGNDQAWDDLDSDQADLLRTSVARVVSTLR